MNVIRSENGTFMKGNKVNQGRVPSANQRMKQAVAMRGRRLSDEHKEKIRAGIIGSSKQIGRPKGGTPWNKGRGEPKEAKEKRDTRFQKGMASWNTGKECSEATKAKIGNANKGRVLTAEHIRKILTRRTPTSLEMKFQRIVEKNGLPYKFVGDGSFMIGRKNPDFININGEKIAIEVYARYYKLRHAETIQEWKEERSKVFKEYGWEAIFFDETQVNECNILKQLGGSANG